MFNILDFVKTTVFISGVMEKCCGIITHKETEEFYTVVLYSKRLTGKIRLLSIHKDRIEIDKNKTFSKTDIFEKVNNKIHIICSYYCDMEYESIFKNKSFHIPLVACMSNQAFLMFINDEIDINDFYNMTNKQIKMNYFLNIGSAKYSKPYIGSFKNVKQEIL